MDLIVYTLCQPVNICHQIKLFFIIKLKLYSRERFISLRVRLFKISKYKNEFEPLVLAI